MPSPAASAPFDQSRYQVRLEWGVAGLARLEPADIVIVVDVLRFSSTVSARVAAGESVALDDAAHAVSRNGAAVAAAAAGTGAVVVLGCLRNAGAAAAEVVTEQARRGDRTSVAVIAAGELVGPRGGADPRDGAGPRDAVDLSGAAGLRVAVEDLLGAGAIVDALSVRGIDHTSPEAAAACEAFRGLRGAATHLLTASGSGQELLAEGRRDEVLAAAALDVDATVPVLRDGVFVAA